MTDLNTTRATGLRDFFLATDHQEMRAACEGLYQSGWLPELSQFDWREIEFAFNRLFIGPQSPIAPPFASVYLEPEGYLMGETTQFARRIYNLLGLKSPWEGQLPDDHISLELDLCLHIRHAIVTTGFLYLQPIYEHFLQVHLQQWVPPFIGRIDGMKGLPKLISILGQQLNQWLETEIDWLNSRWLDNPESPIHIEERHL